MKKIFTLLAAALLTLKSFADYRDARLMISYQGNNNIWIEVDGRHYDDCNGFLQLNNLQPGRHMVEVYEVRYSADFWKGLLGMKRRKEYLFFNTLTFRPGVAITVMIDRWGRAMVTEDRRDDRYGRDRDDRWGRDRERHDRDDHWGREREDHDDRWGRGHDDDDDDDHDYRRDDRGYDNGYDNGSGRGYDYNRNVMDARSFEMLKQALRRENFENSRLEIVKQTIDRNSFSTQQVQELCQLFAFENNKLDLAKYAYGHTVDRENYGVVYDVFAFKGSRDELGDYCRRYR